MSYNKNVVQYRSYLSEEFFIALSPLKGRLPIRLLFGASGLDDQPSL